MLRFGIAVQYGLERRRGPVTGIALALPFAFGGCLVIFSMIGQLVG
jgi:hypothetical protein